MRARAPLDVDLEDKLIYGLTPMRLAYLVIGLLSGFALWSPPWAPSPVRAVACLAVVACGAIAAWGRWRGRAVDEWVADLSLFVIATHRVVVDVRWLQHFKRSRREPAPALASKSPTAIVVTGRAPKAGATTVATELAACLVIKGYRQELWSVRQISAGDRRKATPSEPHLSVVAVPAGRVCYLDRGAGPLVAAVIPEDGFVREAAAINQPTVIAFPDAPASKAFSDLVDLIAAAS